MQKWLKTFRKVDQHSSQHVSKLTLLQNRVRQSSEECFSSLLLLNGFSDPYTSTFLPIWASATSVTVATGSSQPSVPQTFKLDVVQEHFARKCNRTRIKVTLGLGAKGWRSRFSSFLKCNLHIPVSHTLKQRQKKKKTDSKKELLLSWLWTLIFSNENVFFHYHCSQRDR